MRRWALGLLLLGSCGLAGGAQPTSRGIQLLNGTGTKLQVSACDAARCSPWHALGPGMIWHAPPLPGTRLLSVSDRPGQAQDFLLSGSDARGRWRLINLGC